MLLAYIYFILKLKKKKSEEKLFNKIDIQVANFFQRALMEFKAF